MNTMFKNEQVIQSYLCAKWRKKDLKQLLRNNLKNEENDSGAGRARVKKCEMVARFSSENKLPSLLL